NLVPINMMNALQPFLNPVNPAGLRDQFVHVQAEPASEQIHPPPFPVTTPWRPPGLAAPPPPRAVASSPYQSAPPKQSDPVNWNSPPFQGSTFDIHNPHEPAPNDPSQPGAPYPRHNSMLHPSLLIHLQPLPAL